MSSPRDAASSLSGFQGVQLKRVLFCFFSPICRMSLTDWCKFFTEADVCRLINTSVMSVHKTWHEVVHFGSWTKNAEPLLNRCGGCSNHRQTFLQNPQVYTHLHLHLHLLPSNIKEIKGYSLHSKHGSSTCLTSPKRPMKC